MPILALDHLDPHPANANRMTPAMLAKLKTHIECSGDYPPLIVRRHPSDSDRFQILDGHHRALALRELGFDHARCEIWEVPDDNHAALLLLTLNRLHGEDDPRKRGLLIDQLRNTFGPEELAKLLPDRAEQIRALSKLAHPPLAETALAAPPDEAAMPQAITFFLTAAQKNRLTHRLGEIARDRSAALVQLLHLDG